MTTSFISPQRPSLLARSNQFGVLILLSVLPAIQATEFHVAIDGEDSHPGTATAPLRTIQRAADLAQPGDVITVHAGIYRERINPPRGGSSNTQRIVYQAAPGEAVEIRGSEVIKGWTKVEGEVWKVTLPNQFFGEFNPYSDLIQGDWFNPRGREHHTGAVYLHGDWLIEAAKLDDVMLPAGTAPDWLSATDGQYLLNVAWFQPVATGGKRPQVAASGFAAQQGVQTAPCDEGGECIGWIDPGDWVRYEAVDLGSNTEQLEIRAASITQGGVIEIHLDHPEGTLLGKCSIPNTGGWQSWSSFDVRIKPTSGVQTLCLVFRGHTAPALSSRLWYAKVDSEQTTIWAQFPGVNPNDEQVEINARQTVFYPDQPRRNYLTVRGFSLRHAATPWAPPTAEQIGLIGTHWSRGWIIESNIISHSTCSGVALGKYGDQWDNTSADTAEGYVKTIERALANGWNKETTGHHLVRNNTISHCEQAGIVGSLGATFCTVANNEIHDIHVRRLFTGAEMAGIKLHAAIDTTIRGNHIYRTCRGLWLDWMAQGTRVTGNLFHDNTGEDLFVEVNHGPFLIDNNLFLSGISLLDWSQGGSYAHNLFNGKIISRPELNRETPYHPAHTTQLAGLVNIRGGDNRFYNNILVGRGDAEASQRDPTPKDPGGAGGYGLWVYDFREFPSQVGNNVYCNGAQPYGNETNPLVAPNLSPNIRCVEEAGDWVIYADADHGLGEAVTALVTTRLLGNARIPGLPYENPDGSPLTVDTDYFGRPRNTSNPTPGPVEGLGEGELTLKVW